MWYLSLSENSLGDDGASALIEALVHCPPSVEHLDLQSNNLVNLPPRQTPLGACQVYL